MRDLILALARNRRQRRYEAILRGEALLLDRGEESESPPWGVSIQLEEQRDVADKAGKSGRTTR